MGTTISSTLAQSLMTERFTAVYPVVYHVADVQNWHGIQGRGLLSTSALLQLFDVGADDRIAYGSRRRTKSVTLRHKEHGHAVLRDQNPIDDAGLVRSLEAGLTPADWYERLNGHVFFWPNMARVQKFLNASEHRSSDHLLFALDTSRLLAAHREAILLSPINTGSTKPMPQPRGRNCFVPLDEYPLDWRLKKYGKRRAVAEVAVRTSVPDVFDFLLTVDRVGKGRATAVWRPSSIPG